MLPGGPSNEVFLRVLVAITKLNPQVSTLLIYLFLAGLGLHWCTHGLSLVAESDGHSLVSVHGFLPVVASFVMEHRLQVLAL